MNRAQRRKQGIKQPKADVKKLRGEDLMRMRTETIKSFYPDFTTIFLQTLFDEVDFQTYPNHMGRLDRVERQIRKRIAAMEDIASADEFMKNYVDMREIVGIQFGRIADVCTDLNTKGLVGKTYTLTRAKYNEMTTHAGVAAFSVYFPIYILALYDLTKWESQEDGKGYMDRVVDRYMLKVDCLEDEYAQMTFELFREGLKDEVGYVVKPLD
ncbi:MAG: hypothetical protein NC131_19570 [Roseburia sp.]|nr:hypothetical protein [Roseburia sp.]